MKASVKTFKSSKSYQSKASFNEENQNNDDFLRGDN